MSWEIWHFAFNVTLPSLLMLLLGILLRRLRLIDDVFCDGASRLVFNLSLPCLLFFSTATNHPSLGHYLWFISYGALATVVSFLLLEWVASVLVENPRERGIFVQGGFRANTAIVGLAYCASAYGEEGIAVGSLYLIVTVILYNLLSVITLTRSLQYRRVEYLVMARDVVTNPLIIAIVLGFLYSLTKFTIPQVIRNTGGFISGMALPLALLCTGASIDWRTMFSSSPVAAYATVAKLLVVPILITMGGWLMGLQGVTLGVIYLLTATPTAAASYVMTRAMGGNASLAANIIAMTTLGSFFTTALGIYILRHWSLI